MGTALKPPLVYILKSLLQDRMDPGQAPSKFLLIFIAIVENVQRGNPKRAKTSMLSFSSYFRAGVDLFYNSKHRVLSSHGFWLPVIK